MAQQPKEATDEDLVKQVLDGDKESYGILINRYRNLAFRMSLQKLDNLEMAKDAVQDTFIAAYENLDRLRNPSSFGSWIAGITKNICGTILREMGKQPVSLDYLADIGVEPIDSGDSSFDKEILEAVRKCIPRLSQKHRDIIELRYTEGYSCKKIASFLSLSESAVKSRLFHARKRLLKCLHKEGWS